MGSVNINLKTVLVIALILVALFVGVRIGDQDSSLGGVTVEKEEFLGGVTIDGGLTVDEVTSTGDFTFDDLTAGDGAFSGTLGVTGASTLSATTTIAGRTTISIGDLFVGTASSTACMKLRDSDDAGFSYVTILDGTITATTTSCE